MLINNKNSFFNKLRNYWRSSVPKKSLAQRTSSIKNVWSLYDRLFDFCLSHRILLKTGSILRIKYRSFSSIPISFSFSFKKYSKKQNLKSEIKSSQIGSLKLKLKKKPQKKKSKYWHWSIDWQQSYKPRILNIENNWKNFVKLSKIFLFCFRNCWTKQFWPWWNKIILVSHLEAS